MNHKKKTEKNRIKEMLKVYYEFKMDQLFEEEVENVKDLHYKEKYPKLNEEELREKKT